MFQFFLWIIYDVTRMMVCRAYRDNYRNIYSLKLDLVNYVHIQSRRVHESIWGEHSQQGMVLTKIHEFSCRFSVQALLGMNVRNALPHHHVEIRNEDNSSFQMCSKVREFHNASRRCCLPAVGIGFNYPRG